MSAPYDERIQALSGQPPSVSATNELLLSDGPCLDSEPHPAILALAVTELGGNELCLLHRIQQRLITLDGCGSATRAHLARLGEQGITPAASPRPEQADPAGHSWP